MRSASQDAASAPTVADAWWKCRAPRQPGPDRCLPSCRSASRRPRWRRGRCTRSASRPGRRRLPRPSPPAPAAGGVMARPGGGLRSQTVVRRHPGQAREGQQHPPRAAPLGSGRSRKHSTPRSTKAKFRSFWAAPADDGPSRVRRRCPGRQPTAKRSPVPPPGRLVARHDVARHHDQQRKDGGGAPPNPPHPERRRHPPQRGRSTANLAGRIGGAQPATSIFRHDRARHPAELRRRLRHHGGPDHDGSAGGLAGPPGRCGRPDLRGRGARHRAGAGGGDALDGAGSVADRRHLCAAGRGGGQRRVELPDDRRRPHGAALRRRLPGPGHRLRTRDGHHQRHGPERPELRLPDRRPGPPRRAVLPAPAAPERRGHRRGAAAPGGPGRAGPPHHRAGFRSPRPGRAITPRRPAPAARPGLPSWPWP